jgi:hypothetical protein
MALRVPPPDKARITAPPPVHHYHQAQPAAPLPAINYQVGLDGLVEFDSLPVEHVRLPCSCLGYMVCSEC